jgi:hypothetical protein
VNRFLGTIPQAMTKPDGKEMGVALTLVLLLFPQPNVRMFTVLQPVLNLVTVYKRENDGSQP